MMNKNTLTASSKTGPYNNIVCNSTLNTKTNKIWYACLINLFNAGHLNFINIITLNMTA